MKLLIITLLFLFNIPIAVQAQGYQLINANTQNPSAFNIQLKVYTDKKKNLEIDAISDAIHILLFDGIPNSKYSTPLLPLSAKREEAPFFQDLFENKLLDFIRSCSIQSEFKKADDNKGTLVNVVVDYNQLKMYLDSQNAISGYNVKSVQSLNNSKKPTLMILPSDNWCSLRLYTTTFDNQGSKVKVSNYAQAFQDDPELGAVISKIGGILTGLGYSLKDAEQLLRANNERQAEDNMTSGKNSGAAIEESPLDNLKKRAKADILIQIWWKINKEGSNKSVSFTLEAFDTYTSKRIGTSSGTGYPSNEVVPVLLEQAVRDHISEFDLQMVKFYDDINKNGREVILNVKKWDNWENDLETEYGDKTILEIIEDWLHENTVNDSFNLSDATENFALFEQVRIPLVNSIGKAMDARGFIAQLQKYLKKNYQIPSKLMVRGLGETNLILGEQ